MTELEQLALGVRAAIRLLRVRRLRYEKAVAQALGEDVSGLVAPRTQPHHAAMQTGRGYPETRRTEEGTR